MERKLIAAAVSSALVLPMAAQAVEFAASGHINRAIISEDGGGAGNAPDAHDGDVQHMDANSSETCFRFTGSEELESVMTAGVQLELGRPTNWRTRHANVYLSTAGGKITIGQAAQAADLMAHARLGGASWLGGVTNWCSYNAGGGSGPACPSNDGGRGQVLRYDTPAIGPASIAVSTGNNDYFDIKLTIAGSMGDAGYDFRIGHIAEYEADMAAVDGSTSIHTGAELTEAHDNLAGLLDDLPDGATVAPVSNLDQPLEAGGNLTDDGTLYQKILPGSDAGTKDVGDITTMSGAVSFGQGTSVAAAWSQQDTGDQVEYQYMELDHNYGDGSIGVYYKTGEYGGGPNDGVGGSVWGIGIGHSLGGGATAYAGYRQISEDKMKDVDLLLAGMLVTFN